MKVQNLYVAKIFFPMEMTQTTDIGISKLIICKKNNEKYTDIETNRNYNINNTIGKVRIVDCSPLSDYYYPIGIKKINNNNNKEEVYKLVKQLKKRDLI